jgi:hypothetical protein
MTLMMPKTSWIALLILITTLAVESAGQTAESAATEEQTPQSQPVPVSDQRASEVRQELQAVLNLYPSTLRQVLRIDPARLTDSVYLGPYPALSAFLDQHPEIAHNPSYFLGSPSGVGSGALDAMIAFMVFISIVSVLMWLIRTLIDYRRWNRLSRVQTEAHTKILDRFTSNEDLLAYVRTPAGSRFLESAPIPLDGEPRAVGATTNRILWSAQAGFVLALGGVGLHFSIPRLLDDGAADPLYVIGTLAIGLGIGFILSAVASLVLSWKLGLLSQQWPGTSAPDSEGASPPS